MIPQRWFSQPSPSRYWANPDRLNIAVVSVQVFWLQTASLFGDLRVPAGLHNDISVGLDSCTPQQLLALADQRASVGGISLKEGGQCQWHSDLEYQPLGGLPDIGKLDLQSPTKAQHCPATLAKPDCCDTRRT